jgi:hypothetical protein
MDDTTYEEAKRCPRCEQPGKVMGIHMNHPRPGAKVETYECVNELCVTYKQRWLVQINFDGTIPTRQKGPKEFQVDQQALDYGKAQVEQIKHQMEEE